MKFSIFLAIFGFLSILLPGVRSASCESDETLVNVITYHGYWLSENSWEIYDEDDDPVDGCSGSDYSYDICSWEYAGLFNFTISYPIFKYFTSPIFMFKCVHLSIKSLYMMKMKNIPPRLRMCTVMAIFV